MIHNVNAIPPETAEAPVTGTCGAFRIRRIGDQTFTCLKGCDAAQGCTLVLRGASFAVLKRVKTLLSFAVFAAHRCRWCTDVCRSRGREGVGEGGSGGGRIWIWIVGPNLRGRTVRCARAVRKVGCSPPPGVR